MKEKVKEKRELMQCFCNDEYNAVRSVVHLRLTLDLPWSFEQLLFVFKDKIVHRIR